MACDEDAWRHPTTCGIPRETEKLLESRWWRRIGRDAVEIGKACCAFFDSRNIPYGIFNAWIPEQELKADRDDDNVLRFIAGRRRHMQRDLEDIRSFDLAGEVFFR